MKLWAHRGVGREVLNPDESTTVSCLRCGNINFGFVLDKKGASGHPPQQIQRRNEFNYLGKRSIAFTSFCLYTKQASD